MNRYILAVRSDTHAGHRAGLLNPETVIQRETAHGDIEEYNPQLSAAQQDLWAWHEEDRQKTEELAGKSPIVFVDMGDITQGNRFVSELVTPAMAEQVQIAAWNAMPWAGMKQVKSVYIAHGTGVHVWGEGSTERLVAEILRATFPRKSIKTAYHYLMNINGFGVDIAHHGPSPSSRNWLRGNNLRLYVTSILRDELDMGHEPAQLVLRGDKHTLEWAIAIHKTKGKYWKMEGWLMPSYCLIGEHARKVMQSPAYVTIGMLAFEIVDGKLLQAYPFVRTLDSRTKEVIL